MTKPTIQINIHDLEEGSKHYAFALDATWAADHLADTGLRFAGTPLQVEFDAMMAGSDVLVRGYVKGQVMTECSRCLGEATLPLRSEYALLFSKSAKKSAIVTEEDLEAAAELEPLIGDIIHLDDYAREYLLLELPMQVVCSEDCKGISVPERIKGPALLGETGIDPRLAPLLELTKKDKG